MRTIQMTLDEALVKDVDRIVKELKTSRSAFTRAALKKKIEEVRLRKMQARDRAGYAKKPVAKGEFDIWEREQIWGDA